MTHLNKLKASYTLDDIFLVVLLPRVLCGMGNTSFNLFRPPAESSPSIAISCHSLPLSALHLCPVKLSLNTVPRLCLGLTLLHLPPFSVCFFLSVSISSSVILCWCPAHRSLLPATFFLSVSSLRLLFFELPIFLLSSCFTLHILHSC